jgi:dTMP kinase
MFITLEGPEGSGKSSQMPALAEYLRQQGYNLVATREPGGTPISDQVRQVIMSMDNKAMHPRTEILLFCAARAQLVEQVIRPHLAQGGWVLSDRYAHSTLAYQGFGHGVSLDTLRSLLNFATGGLWPDLVILLDVDVETGIRRKQKNDSEWNRLDDYDLRFHQRVRQGYLDMVAQDPAHWCVVDAGRPAVDVQQALRRAIQEHLQTVQTR